MDNNEKFGISFENPLYFVRSKDNIDSSDKISLPLKDGWNEIRTGEWVNIFPLNSDIQRQGWKVHISATLDNFMEVLRLVAQTCYRYNVTFKHLGTRDKFLMRNGKLMNRGYAGKYITCYPDEEILKIFLDDLESQLKLFKGPYILSDKRWQNAPIYLRYGVFKKSNTIDDEMLLIDGKLIKDSREASFQVPAGIDFPDFIRDWINGNDEDQGELPFIVSKAFRFSNSGGIYEAVLRGSENEKIILREARRYAGIDLEGEDAVTRLNSEASALDKLSNDEGVPNIVWKGLVWENEYLAVEKCSGVPVNRWVTNNYPIYDNHDATYLARALVIVDKLIKIVKNAHKLGVYHQDIHLGNVLINNELHVSLIDWEQSVTDNTLMRKHVVAAPGFRAWGIMTAGEIDWYGVYQIASYLFFPVIIQSDLVYQYSKQTRIHGEKNFRKLKIDENLILLYKSKLESLEILAGKATVLSDRKVLRPILNDSFNEELPLKENMFVKKFVYGVSEVLKRWPYKWRKFPVHYYGLNIQDGIAFSDVGVIWALSYADSQGYIELDDTTRKMVSDIQVDVVSRASGEQYQKVGLFDGIVGSLWMISDMCNDESYVVFNNHFLEYLDKVKLNRLYDGKAGILLVGIEFASKGRLNNDNNKILLNELSEFAREYIEGPQNFTPVGKGKSRSNNPDDLQAGLFYGHAGYGWLFGEAYRLTKKQEYVVALNLAIKNELSGYVLDSNGSMQYSQGERILPYLSMGSAGLGIVLQRNINYISDEYRSIIPKLLKAVDSNLSVFPGLFNGMAGLKLSQICLDKDMKLKSQNEQIKFYLDSIEKYEIGIGNGVVLAGDNGMRITEDIATGLSGVVMGLRCITDKNNYFLPACQQ